MGLLGTGINPAEFTKTVTGVAEDIRGQVTDFRGVLDLNTQLSPFTFPPQVQAGLEVANQLGIKVPSSDDLTALAQGQIDKYLGGLLEDANGVLDTIDGLLGKVTTLEGDLQDELSKLTWLL